MDRKERDILARQHEIASKLNVSSQGHGNRPIKEPVTIIDLTTPPTDSAKKRKKSNDTPQNTPKSLKRALVRKKVGPVTTYNSTNSSAPNQPLALASSRVAPIYPAVVFEDFWRNVREWDFLLELNSLMANGSGSGYRKQTIFNSDNNNNNNNFDNSSDLDEVNNRKTGEGVSLSPPIPTSFQSARQYKAIYAPHICAESRAQLLSEFASDIQYWKLSHPQGYSREYSNKSDTNKTKSHAFNSNRNDGKSQGPVKVKVSTLNRDIETNTDYITLKIDRIPNETDLDISFTPNDMIFLTDSLNTITSAANGTLLQLKTVNSGTTITAEQDFVFNSNSFTASGPTLHSIVGHTEYSRRSIDALQVKVSRKKWLKFSSQQIMSSSNTAPMFLVRIGSNITALREFTALSRIESMPLLPFILNVCRPSNNDSRNNNHLEPSKLMASMGGSEALGNGFVQYLERKYNSSQIAAIAASASEYGNGGFTLIQGPPGTGKTTTLVAVINSLHIRQFNKYFESVRKIALDNSYITPSAKKLALTMAAKDKPRILVCAPSNAAVDNIILKIMENGFVDGNGSRYNPSIARVGSGQSTLVQPVSLESKVNQYLSSKNDASSLDSEISLYKSELNRIQSEIFRLRRRVDAISNAAPWELSKDWEIRIDENFEDNNKVVFINHKEKSATYECPPPPEPGERHFPASAMPEYRSFLSSIVKLVDRYTVTLSNLERCNIIQRASECDGENNCVMDGVRDCKAVRDDGSTLRTASSITTTSNLDAASRVLRPSVPSVVRTMRTESNICVRGELETHILDSVHIVLTTLGTAGSRTLEAASKFEVVVIDEAAQSVEPSSLTALQLGSKHCILVGDPQQLPATIFSVSGKATKFDRSLFQRLEEAGHPVYMLKVQYRMHPSISEFPRHIFYGGNLVDGPNVEHPEYGNPLRRSICTHFSGFEPFTIFDLDSTEEREGTSMSNMMEAKFALHLYCSIRDYVLSAITRNGFHLPRVAVITPYAQQVNLIRRVFSDNLKDKFDVSVEVNTVDAFQGRESDIVIFSSVRASNAKGIGFLSDVRRMNVALTRAKFFLFVVARCRTISMNPYWNELVQHAKESNSVVRIRAAKDGRFPEFLVTKPLSK